MRSTKEFIKDGLLLTFTSLILRTAGVFFSARLSAIAGNAVMGLYTQIMSVYAFAVTAASAGVNLGAMRITSECLGSGNEDKLSNAVRSCVKYCLTVGIAVALINFSAAPFIGIKIIGREEAVAPLQALSLALPFISLSNAFHGYFNGVKMISQSAVTSLFEQTVRIISTIVCLEYFSECSIKTLCLILVICNASSEALSFLVLYIFYRISKRKLPKQCNLTNYQRKRFLAITVPIALSALIRSALTTLEHILIPIGLRASGMNSDGALAKYGIVSGMVIPILLYPMALLSSFASITISELSARVSSGEATEKIKKTVTKGITLTMIYGIGCTVIIGAFSEQLGLAIYKSSEASDFLRILAPLIIFMYLDHISDGMLKGLDKQNYVMKINIADAALSVLFAMILIPRLGIYGFIISLYICECMNCFFSFGKLFLMLKPNIDLFSSALMPFACAVVSCGAVTVLGGIGLPTTIAIITAISFYLLLLRICGSLTENYGKT